MAVNPLIIIDCFSFSPNILCFTGHSSHVTNVKFMPGGDTLMSSGGNDSSVVVWDVVYDESADDTDKFR